MNPVFQVDVLLRDVSSVTIAEHSKVDSDSDSQKVVHLKQQTQGALLSVEVNSIEFNQLVERAERIVNEQEPIDEVVLVDVLSKRELSFVVQQLWFE